MDVASQKQIAN